MDYQANADQVDASIRKYTAENLEREGVVVGWVLLVASTRFDEEGITHYAYDYSCGQNTNPLLAVGLLDTAGEDLKDGLQRRNEDD